MNVAILGAGSVGCFVGGAWAAAGVAVRFVGRPRIAEEVAAEGLTLTDFSGWQARLAPDAVDFGTRPAALAGADLIVLAVKSHGTAEAAKEIARHARKGALVLSLQNGVSNVETLRAALKDRFEVIQGIVPFNVAHLGHGRFHKGVAGDLIVQEHAATRALAAAVARAPEGAPARLRLADDMPAVAWGKLLINLNNAVNALSGRSLLEQLKQRDYRRVVAASIVEALDVLAAAGIAPAQIGPIPPKLLPHAIAAPNLVFNNLFLKVQKIDAKARSSMADDIRAGRPTEIDFLNGEVVRLAQRLKRKAPVNAAIVDLVKQAELGIEHLWSPEDLRAHVLQGHKVAPVFGY
ncbi:2-dehydropantoate 2-reductase [Sphingomonas parva]|uniref:2-dehydropantoate 2-reductase n=2 Tax=Sphingomonas parva TaxID=2555898 RepID=A0A4Y8ZKF9_9SPHN|nr:2-dehydropantoate 2-reductase [Sphingomonas parva]